MGKKRSGYDVTNYFRDNPSASLNDLINNVDSFHPQEAPEEKSPIKRVWSWDEITAPGAQIYVPKKTNIEELDPPPQQALPQIPQNRPTVVIGGDMFEQIDDAIGALDNSATFQQGGQLVRVVQTDPVLGSACIKDHVPISIKDQLSRDAEWKKWKSTKEGPELVSTDGPTFDICKGVLARGEYRSISVIRGVTDSPFLRKDKSICIQTGFDCKSGFYLNLSTSVKPPPKRPTRFQAAEAYLTLLDPFLEFPFVDQCSMSIPIALILSVIARPTMTNVPVFVFDASTRGSGKTLVSDICSIILTGKPVPKFTWPGGRDGNDELEKTMNTIAMSGTPLMCFDNIPSTSRFGGGIIEKFLTCGGRVNFRKLGGNDNRDVDWTTVMIANGNNILDGIQDETRRRALPCRMVPDCEHPEERSGFKRNPLQKYVAEHRGEYLTAALTILQYAIQNNTDSVKSWGSFEEFASLIPVAISLAGGPDIMSNRDLVPSSGGEENDAIVTLMTEIMERFTAGFTVKDLLRRAENSEDLKDSMESVFFGRMPNSRELGKMLRSRKDRIHDGMKVIDTGSKKQRAVVWNIVRTQQLELKTDVNTGDY